MTFQEFNFIGQVPVPNYTQTREEIGEITECDPALCRQKGKTVSLLIVSVQKNDHFFRFVFHSFD
jgi:hypothetical protein